MVDLQGVLVMGRKRVANPRISFSISMSQTMKQQIDHRLSYNSDRSKWIVSAIHAKLNASEEADDALGKASMLDLMLELQYRSAHPAFKSMFTRGSKEMIQNLCQKSKDLPESGE